MGMIALIFYKEPPRDADGRVAALAERGLRAA